MNVIRNDFGEEEKQSRAHSRRGLGFWRKETRAIVSDHGVFEFRGEKRQERGEARQETMACDSVIFDFREERTGQARHELSEI